MPRITEEYSIQTSRSVETSTSPSSRCSSVEPARRSSVMTGNW